MNSNSQSITKYINIIDYSLSMQESSILKQMDQMIDFNAKLKFLEFVENNYMQTFFKTNRVVLHEFKTNYVTKILNESTINLSDRVSTYFNFIRKSLLFETWLININVYAKHQLNEEGVWDSIKSGAGAVWDKTKQVAKQVGNAATAVVKKGAAVVKGVWNKVMESELTWFVPGLNIVKLGYEVQKNWEKIKKMTLADWIEEFRGFLNSGTGIAIQILLALTGAGNIVNMIAWGALLAYDVGFAGVAQGDWNWYNIITSAVGILGSGAAALVFKPLKSLLGTIKSIEAFVPGLKRTPAVWKSVGGWISKIVQGGGTIVSKITSSIAWLIQKIPGLKTVLAPLNKGIAWVKNMFDIWAKGLADTQIASVAGVVASPLVKGAAAYVKGGGVQNIGKLHNYLKSPTSAIKGLGKKLSSKYDQDITKAAVGTGTKAYHTIKKVGSSLATLAAAYKKPIDQLIRLNPGFTAANANMILPVNRKIRVA